MENQLDQVARLTLLEGALQMEKGSLLRSPRRSLRELKGRKDLHPQWTQQESTGVYHELFLQVAECRGIETAEDIMQMAMAGVGMQGDPVINPFRSAGACTQFRLDVANGKSPRTCVDNSPLSLFLWRKAAADYRHQGRTEMVHRMLSPLVGEPNETPAVYLARFVFDPKSELAQRVRDLILSACKGVAAFNTMKLIMRDIQAGRPLDRKKVAKKLGIRPQAVYKYWHMGWALFAEALGKDTRMQRDLEDHLRHAGFLGAWEPAPVMDTIQDANVHRWMAQRAAKGAQN